jgi:hypothetical protein
MLPLARMGDLLKMLRDVHELVNQRSRREAYRERWRPGDWSASVLACFSRISTVSWQARTLALQSDE